MEQKMKNNGILAEVFGGVSAKVLEFMSTFREYDYSKQEIAKGSGVSPRHAVIALEKLEKLELVKKTRNMGHAHMYKYNIDNEAAKLLQKFALTLACQEYKKLPKPTITEQDQEKAIVTVPA